MANDSDDDDDSYYYSDSSFDSDLEDGRVLRAGKAWTWKPQREAWTSGDQVLWQSMHFQVIRAQLNVCYAQLHQCGFFTVQRHDDALDEDGNDDALDEDGNDDKTTNERPDDDSAHEQGTLVLTEEVWPQVSPLR